MYQGPRGPEHGAGPWDGQTWSWVREGPSVGPTRRLGVACVYHVFLAIFVIGGKPGGPKVVPSTYTLRVPMILKRRYGCAWTSLCAEGDILVHFTAAEEDGVSKNPSHSLSRAGSGDWYRDHVLAGL